MSINPSITIPIFEGAFKANKMTGPSATQLAIGCANGLFQYMSGYGCVITSIDIGILGVGKGTGSGIIIPEPVILGAMIPILAGHLIVGPFSPVTANAISMGISLALASALINTVDPGVGTGAGKIILVPNGAGSAIFASALVEAGLVGPMSVALGTSIGLTLDTVASAAQGVTVILGPSSPIPSTGLGVGTIS